MLLLPQCHSEFPSQSRSRSSHHTNTFHTLRGVVLGLGRLLCGYLGSTGMQGRKVMGTPMEIHEGFRRRSTAWDPHILRRGARVIRSCTPRRVVVLEEVEGPVLGERVGSIFECWVWGGRCNFRACTAREPVFVGNTIDFEGPRK